MKTVVWDTGAAEITPNAGMEYRKNDGDWTSSAFTVARGDKIDYRPKEGYQHNGLVAVRYLEEKLE